MRSCFFFCLLAFLFGGTTAQAADDFRMETDIYIESQKEPLLQTLTLFSGGVVYDFMQPGLSEITTFDPERGQFVLLDSKRRIKTSVTTEQILEFLALVKANADQDRQQELIEPQFEVEWDEESGWLALSSRYLVYRAKGQAPKLESAVERYRDFADWYARLNAMHPSNLPPFGRLELNAALADRDMIPHEVVRTVRTGSGLSRTEFEVRSRHLAVWQLSRTDRQKIELVGRYKAEFKEVSFQEYRRSTKLVASRGDK